MSVDANPTNCLTELPQPDESLHSWGDCDALVAEALEMIQAAYYQRPENSRYRAMTALVRHRLQPALLVCLKTARGTTTAFECVFGAGGLTDDLKRPAVLDRNLCRLGWLSHGAIDTTINPLRDAMRWIASKRSVRQVPTTRSHLKGENRRLVPALIIRDHEDWPYCEYCEKLSQHAEWLKECHGKAKMTAVSSDQMASDPSYQFCCDHDPTDHPSEHRHASRKKDLFKDILKAIGREQRLNKRFRKRFAEHAWETTSIDSLQTREDVEALASSDPISPLLNPVEMLARKYANRIARELPDSTLLAIAELKAKGMRQAAIASQLDISREAVSQRIKRCRGYFDFSRKSPLLYWWPDAEVIDNPFVLKPDETRRRSKPQA